MALTGSAAATVTLLPIATQTIELLPTATATVWDESLPAYIDSSSGTLSFVNVALIFSNLIVIAILGTFNRLVAIPLVASTCLCVANALDWFGWLTVVSNPDTPRRIAIIFSNILYTCQDLSVSLYSFFLLKMILSGTRRRVYVIVFVFFYITLIGLRGPAIAALDRYATSPESEGADIGHIVDQLTQAYLVIMAGLESWSAFFLIRAFYSAKSHTTSHRGLCTKRMWISLARSTELRVSLLAVYSITRVVCFRSWDGAQTLKNIDWFAFVMINCFPLVLQLDLLAAKMLLLKAAAGRPQRPSTGNAMGAIRPARESARRPGTTTASSRDTFNSSTRLNSARRNAEHFRGRNGASSDDAPRGWERMGESSPTEQHLRMPEVPKVPWRYVPHGPDIEKGY